MGERLTGSLVSQDQQSVGRDVFHFMLMWEGMEIKLLPFILIDKGLYWNSESHCVFKDQFSNTKNHRKNNRFSRFDREKNTMFKQYENCVHEYQSFDVFVCVQNEKLLG